MSASDIVIGMIGRSPATIAKGATGFCYFPLGKEDMRYRGGRTWVRVKVTALEAVRENVDVIVSTEKREIQEYTIESPLTNEKPILTSSQNILAAATLTTDPFDTSGYNKITGFIHADQNITLYIEQSADKSHWDVTSMKNYTADSNTGGYSAEVVAPYARVRCVNASSSTATTHFRRQVQLSSGA